MKKTLLTKLLLLILVATNAQPFTLNPSIEPKEIKLEEHFPRGSSKADGRIKISAITQQADTAYFFAGGMSMYAPTHVLLSNEGDSANIQIDLFKENWIDVMKKGEVKAGSSWDKSFKTEGDFGIRIVTNKVPCNYILTVFSGNEINFDLPTAFTNKTVEKNSSGIIKWLTNKWIIIAASILLLLLLLLKFKKMKITTLLIVLYACTFPASSNAQDDPSFATRTNTLLQRELTDDEIEAVEGRLNQLNSTITTGRDAFEAWNTLTTLNPGECTPDFSTNSQAMMPSTCQGDAACYECFTKAARELNFIRRQLGRLSCIYNNTKTYTSAALSFGDNVSGIHGMMGLAWQNERPSIVQSMENMKTTCKQKYIDMIGSLERALKTIDGCEKNYGMPDWYQRFGFIYFEFMKEKYKIVD